MGKREVLLSLIAIIVMFPHPCIANLVINDGFETQVDIAGRPTDFGYWGGDYAEIVTANNGIVPFERSQMLQFLYANPVGPSTDVGCTIWQLVDISEFAVEVSSGSAIATLSGWFNRVAGDGETDTEFFIDIWACAGSPSNFPSLGAPLARSYAAHLYSDDDEATWQLTTAELVLPTNTEFVAIKINAQEDIFNDTTGVEFDGHYVDAVSFEIIPEPAIEAAIDIKPGSCPNPLNVKSKGVLPVAVSGSEDFDVTTIDVASIRLADVGPIRSSYDDVATPVSDANDCNCTIEGPDGFLDLTLKFKTQRIVEAVGDVNDGDIRVLELTGVLIDPIPFETPIEGADCVLVRGKHKPFNKADINKDGVVDNIDFAILAESWLRSSIVED